MTATFTGDLFYKIQNPVSFNELVYAEEKVIDYRILDVNPAFENLLNLPRSKIIDRLATQLYQETPPRDIDIYAAVSQTGVARSFKTFIQRTDTHLLVSAVSTEPGKFSAVFTDVSQYIETCIEQEKKIRKLEIAALKADGTTDELVPICSNCKRIRDNQNTWVPVEAYISKHFQLRFSHGICPNCMKILYPGYIMEEQEQYEDDN